MIIRPVFYLIIRDYLSLLCQLFTIIWKYLTIILSNYLMIICDYLMIIWSQLFDDYLVLFDDYLELIIRHYLLLFDDYSVWIIRDYCDYSMVIWSQLFVIICHYLIPRQAAGWSASFIEHGTAAHLGDGIMLQPSRCCRGYTSSLSTTRFCADLASTLIGPPL